MKMRNATFVGTQISKVPTCSPFCVLLCPRTIAEYQNAGDEAGHAIQIRIVSLNTEIRELYISVTTISQKRYTADAMHTVDSLALTQSEVFYMLYIT